MPPTIQDLHDERRTLIAQAGNFVRRAQAERRDLYGDEHEQFNRLHDQAADLDGQIQAMKAAAVATPAADPAAGVDLSDLAKLAGGFVAATVRGNPVFVAFGTPEARRAAPEYVAAFRAYLAGSRQAQAVLRTDFGDQGGYLAPPQFVAELVADLDSGFWLRGLCNVLPPTAAPEVIRPRRTARSEFAWSAEIERTTPDDSLKLGSFKLTPHYMSAEFEVSRGLVAGNGLSAEAVVRGEVRDSGGALEERAFLAGDGDGKPLGLFVPSEQGVPASRDVTGPATSLDVTWNAKLRLRAPYLRSPSLRWLFHRNAIRHLAKLTDASGQPLWRPAERAGEPDLLHNTAIAVTDEAPVGSGPNGVYQSGDYLGLIGDLSCYDVIDGMDMGFTRHTDSNYARRHMVGFIVRRKVDGAPRVGEAFARVKVA